MNFRSGDNVIYAQAELFADPQTEDLIDKPGIVVSNKPDKNNKVMVLFRDIGCLEVPTQCLEYATYDRHYIHGQTKG